MGGDETISTSIIDISLNSFQPDTALNNCEKFLSAIKDTEYSVLIKGVGEVYWRWLISLFSGSQYLSDILIRHPEDIPWVINVIRDKRSRFKDEMTDELSAGLDGIDDRKEELLLLRRFKQREYLRIGGRDLSKDADTVETLEDISNVADVLIHKAYELALTKLTAQFGTPFYLDDNDERRESKFVVIGMGKLGGKELNFSSDIDLIYIYTSEKGETDGTGGHSISNHEFYTLLSREITKILNEATEEGILYRVDLELRPEGGSGDVTNSLRSAEIYYESWGATWERQAFIKARPVGGEIELGKEFLKMMIPFVYRKYLDYAALGEIKEMKEKINRNIQSEGDSLHTNVKLGYGGIREIEFLIQAFQLLYGGREIWFRKSNSMRALHRISEKAFLTYSEYSDIYHSYFFLRDLENRIQMDECLQKHLIPSSENDRAALARKMGYKGKDRTVLASRLMEEYRKCTDKVREIYNKLFFADFINREEADTDEVIKISLEDRGTVIPLLKKVSFENIEGAYRILLLMRDGGAFAHPSARSRDYFAGLLPVILNEFAAVSHPDKGLINFERFVDAGRSRETLYEILSIEKGLIPLLCRIFGESQYLSDTLIQQPSLIDCLVPLDTALVLKDRVSLFKEFEESIKGSDSYENGLDMLRKYKSGEELRIGAQTILNSIGLGETFRGNSDLADSYINLSLRLVESEMSARYGTPLFEKGTEGGLAIIALGKLGGREMNFGSDIDILFVCSGEGETSGGSEDGLDTKSYYTRLCERLIHAIGWGTRYGFGYKVDTRLRPEGEQGPLVIDIGGYERYYNTRVSIWERQSLIKARFVAGSERVGEKFISLATKVAYEGELGDSLRDSIYQMKIRMEEERAQKRDIKLGKGGIVDIEFTVQYLQMFFGKDNPDIRVASTYEAIDGLSDLDRVAKGDLEILKKGYYFLRNIEKVLRLDDTGKSVIPAKEGELRLVLGRLGYDSNGGDKFTTDYEKITSAVRGVFERVFSEDYFKGDNPLNPP